MSAARWGKSGPRNWSGFQPGPEAGPRLPATCFEESERLFTLALKLTGNRSDAQDLFQETWYRALRAAPLFQGDSPCRTWLATIMRNSHIDRWRRKEHKPEGRAVSLDGLRLGEEDPEGCPVVRRGIVPRSREAIGTCLKFCFSDQTRRAVLALPGKQREILLLRTIGGLSYEELSNLLGIPLGTVMSRLSRAKGMMKRLLAPGEAA